jgi:glucokinase
VNLRSLAFIDNVSRHIICMAISREIALLIVGDIGGTTTCLALVSMENGPREFVAEEEFHSGDCNGLEAIVEVFSREDGGARHQPALVCRDRLLRDGPHLTNLPWNLEEGALCRSLHLSAVSLLNDLQAVAHAVPQLRPEETVVINEGKAVEHAAIAILAPGTGLGEAFLIWSGSEYISCPSEGGHADFAPTN